MKFVRKHWSNILIILVIILLTIPQTRTEIQIFVNRLLASTPAKIEVENQKKITSYYWPLEDPYGRRKNLEHSKNKVVFMNYWATWCPPCIAEMPDLEKLYQQYGDQVDFYFVTSDDPEKVRNFMSKHEYTFPVYFSTGKKPENLSSNSLPTTYVIAKNGKIVFDKTGTANWNSDRFTSVLDHLIAE